MRVLVADDEPIPRLMLTKALAGWGYEPVPVRDGDEAWSALTAPDPPPLAVLDWVMPGADGVEVCRRLRALPGQRYIYTIVLTAKDQKADLVAALESGADDYVTKPFDPQELRVRLRTGRRIVELEAALRRQALHDPLTGVLNHGAAGDALRRELARAARAGEPTGVLMIDADHFKRVNDTHGHPVGDAVLRELARRLAGQLRACDVLGRYGGEEFIAVLPGSDAAGVAVAGERVRAGVSAAPIDTAAGGLSVTVSVGGASAPPGAAAADEWVGRADRALYAAKTGGRNRGAVDG